MTRKHYSATSTNICTSTADEYEQCTCSKKSYCQASGGGTVAYYIIVLQHPTNTLPLIGVNHSNNWMRFDLCYTVTYLSHSNVFLYMLILPNLDCGGAGGNRKENAGSLPDNRYEQEVFKFLSKDQRCDTMVIKRVLQSIICTIGKTYKDFIM